MPTICGENASICLRRSPKGSRDQDMSQRRTSAPAALATDDRWASPSCGCPDGYLVSGKTKRILSNADDTFTPSGIAFTASGIIYSPASPVGDGAFEVSAARLPAPPAKKRQVPTMGTRSTGSL